MEFLSFGTRTASFLFCVLVEKLLCWGGGQVLNIKPSFGALDSK